MTIYCYDTEFLEDGNTIDLISIGIVCEDGREYYAVNADCRFDEVRDHDWLWDNVVRYLPTTKRDWTAPQLGRSITRLDMTSALVKPHWVIANEVREFLTAKIAIEVSRKYDGETVETVIDGSTMPELWAYFCAYDHVALAQLWGPMSLLPEHIPMFTNDLMQVISRTPGFVKPAMSGDQHNALDDARWNLQVLTALREAQS